MPAPVNEPIDVTEPELVSIEALMDAAKAVSFGLRLAIQASVAETWVPALIETVRNLRKAGESARGGGPPDSKTIRDALEDLRNRLTTWHDGQKLWFGHVRLIDADGMEAILADVCRRWGIRV